VLPASGGIEAVEPRERARLLRGRTILLAGGGNLGDLWPTPHALREEILEWCRDSPIVQLPQSIHFRSRAALRRTRNHLERHGNVTLLLRDRRSFEIAREEFAVRSELCPDMAFLVRPPIAPTQPCADILWLCRDDRESRRWPLDAPARDVVRIDWMQDAGGFPNRMNRFLMRQRMLHPRVLEHAGSLQLQLQRALAIRHTQRGCRLLSGAAAVMTDRLHGHILCTLLGIPHVVLDNTYGKLRSFYETWTSGVEYAHWCDSAVQGIDCARRQNAEHAVISRAH
jgi:pyruvyl transferase EpsO